MSRGPGDMSAYYKKYAYRSHSVLATSAYFKARGDRNAKDPNGMPTRRVEHRAQDSGPQQRRTHPTRRLEVRVLQERTTVVRRIISFSE